MHLNWKTFQSQNFCCGILSKSKDTEYIWLWWCCPWPLWILEQGYGDLPLADAKRALMEDYRHDWNLLLSKCSRNSWDVSWPLVGKLPSVWIFLWVDGLVSGTSPSKSWLYLLKETLRGMASPWSRLDDNVLLPALLNPWLVSCQCNHLWYMSPCTVGHRLWHRVRNNDRACTNSTSMLLQKCVILCTLWS
jgi:hypothetical protein